MTSRPSRGQTDTDSDNGLADLAARLRLPLMRLARGIRRHGAGELTPAQLSALARIAESEPVTLGRLAAIEQVRPPSITRMTALLEEKGLIQRTTEEADRRCTAVAATPKGRRLLARVRESRDSFLAERLGGLPAADLARLESVVDILERLAEDVRPPEEIT